jgi:hypothetical protein
MGDKVDVDITVSLSRDDNGDMVISVPSSTDVYDDKLVDWKLSVGPYPGAYILTIEFLDSANGPPSVDRSGPFKEPPEPHDELTDWQGKVKKGLAESSWYYRLWINNGGGVGSHDPTLINKK